MEEPRSYEALLARDDPSGRSQWSEGLSHATHTRAHGGCRKERNQRVSAWVTFYQKIFFQWVDMAKAIPKVGSPTGNIAAKKVVKTFFRQPR